MVRMLLATTGPARIEPVRYDHEDVSICISWTFA